MRGGTYVRGQPNPMPRRTVPWGLPTPTVANVFDSSNQPAPTGETPSDVSPYGVLDLAANVQEWTRSQMEGDGTFYAARGCGWAMCTSAQVPSVLAIINARRYIQQL